jgi:hypothetical protein
MLKLNSVVAISILGLSLCTSYSELLKGTIFDISSLSSKSLPLKKHRECSIKSPKAEVKCEDIHDIIVRRRKCVFYPINTRVTKRAIRFSRCKPPRRYVELTLEYIRRSVGKSDFGEDQRERMTKILTIIRDHFNGTPNDFALFTASALHNTSFLKYFESNEKKTYRSRSLLMICGLRNYEKLDEVSEGLGCNYVKYPDTLAKPNKSNIVNVIRFWNRIMPRKAKLSFKDMMRALRTVSWVEYDTGKVLRPAGDLKFREKIYEDLLDLYEQ